MDSSLSNPLSSPQSKSSPLKTGLKRRTGPDSDMHSPPSKKRSLTRNPSNAEAALRKNEDTEWEAVMALTSLKARDNASPSGKSSEDRRTNSFNDQLTGFSNNSDTPPPLLTPSHKELPHPCPHPLPSSTPLPSPAALTTSHPKAGPRLLQLPPLLRLPTPATWQGQRAHSQQGTPSAPSPHLSAPSSHASESPHGGNHLAPLLALSPGSPSELSATLALSSSQPSCDTCLSLSLQCKCQTPKQLPPHEQQVTKSKPAVVDLTLWPSTACSPPPTLPALCHVAASPSGSGLSEEGFHSGPDTPCSAVSFERRGSCFTNWREPAQKPRTAHAMPTHQHKTTNSMPIPVTHLALFPEIQELGHHWEALLAKMQECVPGHQNGGGVVPGGMQREQLSSVAHSEEYRRLSGYLESLVVQLQHRQKQQQCQNGPPMGHVWMGSGNANQNGFQGRGQCAELVRPRCRPLGSEVQLHM